jgi:hypothetical protein
METQWEVSVSKRMKTVWKSFLRDPCRTRELTDEERLALPHYEHLQRYFPALDAFRPPESASAPIPLTAVELPSRYYLQGLHSDSPCTSTTRSFHALRTDTSKADQDEHVPCRAFMKVVHLVHPIDRIREKYTAPPHPLLPASPAWTKTIAKIHHRNNQAYVDTIANYVLSRYRERDLLPHLVLYYGAYTGMSKSYRYNLTGEYDSYRQYRWFWDGLKAHRSRLTLTTHSVNQREQTWFQRLYHDMTQPPVEEELLSLSPSSSTGSLGSTDTMDSKVECDTLLGDELVLDSVGPDVSLLDSVGPDVSLLEVDTLDIAYQEDQEDQESNDSKEEIDSQEDEDEVDVFLEVPNVPVMMILQEAQEGSMDELLEKEDLDGHEYGSAEWEKRWVAWIFQVVATLTFLQNAISFTHNDLHTNNILWRSTDQPYLYYRVKKDTTWRVPTYGKIFSLIDFGRSIFRLGKHQWISDDHWPNEDAAGQYNYGPFYDKSKPKVEPNPSFDLCRLSVSLLSGLYDEPPPKRKGKKVHLLSEEGSWKVYETESTLYNLLWTWTLDDKGRTVYETEEGEERYEGFDLYLQIAHHVHGAVPAEQLQHPIFQGFVWKKPVPVEEKVYGLDA